MIGAKVTTRGDFPDVEDALSRFINRWTSRIKERALAKMREPKHGRLYKKGAIRGRKLKGLRRLPGTKTRYSRGTEIHRAAAKGEAPARDTGTYEQDLKIIYPSSFEAAIRTSLAYPLPLEEEHPMWLPVVEEFRAEMEKDLVKEILK